MCLTALHKPPISAMLQTNASLVGWGAVLKIPCKPPTFARGLWTPAKPNITAVKEIRAVHHTDTTFFGLLTGPTTLKIHTDNANVLYTLLCSTSQASWLHNEYSQFFHLLRQSMILLWPFYIPLALNKEVDTLLRLPASPDSLLQFGMESRLNPCVFRILQCKWHQGPLQWVNQFAAPANNQLPMFWSPTPVPFCSGVNSLSASWAGATNYIYPPKGSSFLPSTFYEETSHIVWWSSPNELQRHGSNH